MKVIFFNITWMKRYQGIANDDQPKNDNTDFQENISFRESFNFKSFEGYCYGNVYTTESLALEKHFKGISANDEWVDNFTVIWCAKGEDNQTRIIGWYKNAEVNQVEGYLAAYSNDAYSLKFNASALANDCYLIPEEQRTFIIDSADINAAGNGCEQSNVWYAETEYGQNVLLPKVIEYIENYNGEFISIDLDFETLNTTIDDNNEDNDYYVLLNKGIILLNDRCYIEALKYFNTARRIQETAEILFSIGATYLLLNEYKSASELFEKCLDQDYERKDTLAKLITCYDYRFNRLKTLEYCLSIMPYYDVPDDQNALQCRYHYGCLMCDIYTELTDYEEALKIANHILNDIEENKENLTDFIKEIEMLDAQKHVKSLHLISMSNLVKLNLIIKKTELSKELEITIPDLQVVLKADSATKAEQNKNLEKYYGDMDKRTLLIDGRSKTLKQNNESYEVMFSFDSWDNYIAEYSSFFVLSTKPISFGSDYFCQLKLTQALEDENNIYIVKNISKLAGDGAISRLNKGAYRKEVKRERRDELVRRLEKQVLEYDNQYWICIDTISKNEIENKNCHKNIFYNFMCNILNYALTIEDLIIK